MSRTPCISCGRPTVGARCPDHTTASPARVARSRVYATSAHKRTRSQVLERDSYRCVDCGHHDPSGRTLVCDHVAGVLTLADPHDVGACETRCLRCSGRKDGARSGGSGTPGGRAILKGLRSPARVGKTESSPGLVFG